MKLAVCLSIIHFFCLIVLQTKRIVNNNNVYFCRDNAEIWGNLQRRYVRGQVNGLHLPSRRYACGTVVPGNKICVKQYMINFKTVSKFCILICMTVLTWTVSTPGGAIRSRVHTGHLSNTVASASPTIFRSGGDWGWPIFCTKLQEYTTQEYKHFEVASWVHQSEFLRNKQCFCVVKQRVLHCQTWTSA
jgi:hypothetical protein